MLATNVTRIETERRPWVQAHEALSRLASERAAADAEEGRWLLAAVRSAAHLHLGFATFGEYIERLFGYRPRSTQEKLRVADALERLPAMAQALESGALTWSATRELTRVAIPETEHQWLEASVGKTIRQLENLVANKVPGDKPSSAPQPLSERRHILRFDVAPETFALFREAMTALRRGADAMLDDDSALLCMARHVLAGPTDTGRASYQIALDICPRCSSAHQQAAGQLIHVGAEVTAMAHCDAQHLGHINRAPANENANPDVPANDDVHSPAAAHSGADHDDAHVDAPTNAAKPPDRVSVDAHVDATAPTHAAKPPDRVDAATNVASAPAAPPVSVDGDTARPTAFAKQPIPPALRRAILRRDHQRCQVTGCQNSVFLDLHHVQPRSEGGQNQPENLITLCGAHHRAAHRGELLIDGSATDPRFRHADGTEYGRGVSPHAVDVQTKVFSALRWLGFREREVRAVLAELQTREELRGTSAERLLREALRRITPIRT